MAALSAGNLCYLCRTYDFDELFNTPVRDCHEEHLAEDLPRHTLPFGSLNELQSRSEHCEVCGFLTEAWFQARLPSRAIRPDDQFILRRLRARHGVLGWNDIMGVSMKGLTAGCARLEVVDAGFNGVTIAFDPWPPSRFDSAGRFRTFPPDELRDRRTDLSLVKSWMEMCEANHSRCQVLMSKKSDLTELKLIGVDTGEIIRVDSKVQYAALSYVWSQARYSDEKPKCVEREGRLQLPEEIPQVVQDALRVVRSIGLKYLWIDSYCINQHDEEEKRRLIDQMDLVFEGAQVTICATSGRDDPPGIWGVSIPMQKDAQVVHDCTVGTFKTVAILPFTNELSKSLWNWRAWTMEEALLSRRCILFLKNQTALWCKSHCFHDHFTWSRAPDITSSPDAHGVTAGSLAFTLDIPGKDSHWDFEAWSQTLTVYTGRHLSNERDAMRALAGLRNRVTRNTSTPLPFGLPLSTSVCSLLWKIRFGASCSRRDGFPSWSWLGWHATVEFDHWLEPLSSDRSEARYTLAIPRKRHSLWGLREFGIDIVYLRFEARILSFPTQDFGRGEHAPLRLKSYNAHFKVRRIETEDAWQLLDGDGNAVPVIRGYRYTGSDLHLIILPEKKTSYFDPERLEFICIQHWKEARPHGRFGDVVTAIAITRNPNDGKGIRIGSTAIPYKYWKAAEPLPIVVDIV